jgi:hypothetical protein
MDDRPYATSPAFFRSEVLSKYQRDPEKYELTGSTISCRGAWFLRSYGVNDAQQVYVYIKDLASLPYQEQLYWKSFNEEPKAPISEKSFRQDFLGEWWLSPDPLEDLKELLRDFPRATHRGSEVAIWSIGNANLEAELRQLHEVVTDSRKEWEDQILQLTKLTVDGLQERNIRKVAQAMNCDNGSYRSIRLVGEILVALGLVSSDAEQIWKPLASLQRVRSSSGVAHLGPRASDMDFRANFDSHVRAVGKAMTILADHVRKGHFDVPPSNLVAEP